MQDAFLGFSDKASLFYLFIYIFPLFNLKGSIKNINEFCYNVLTMTLTEC